MRVGHGSVYHGLSYKMSSKIVFSCAHLYQEGLLWRGSSPGCRIRVGTSDSTSREVDRGMQSMSSIVHESSESPTIARGWRLFTGDNSRSHRGASQRECPMVGGFAFCWHESRTKLGNAQQCSRFAVANVKCRLASGIETMTGRSPERQFEWKVRQRSRCTRVSMEQ